MKFETNNFSCDVEKYNLDDGKSFILRFYDKKKVQTEDKMQNFVFADPGFGYITLKFIGNDALLSGYLNSSVFSEALTELAVEYTEKLSPYSELAYIPHHIELVKFVNNIEYNGEY